MKRINLFKKNSILFFILSFILLHSNTEAAQNNPSIKTDLKLKTALLVNKRTNEIFVTEYKEGAYQLIKKFHVTLGQVKGDKEDEGDLKTPEGIYTFKQKLLPPSIKPKFGAMAFYLNYPNTYDQLAGRTGFDIMLHATNEPERLKQNYDSEGCVVVKNEEIREIDSYIRVGLTPILVFSENLGEGVADANVDSTFHLPKELVSPGKDTALVNFFQSWVKTWESESLEEYIQHYHSDFSAQGMNKEAWKKYKSGLNQKYASIQVGPEDVMYYRHPKYSMITFTQNYYSKLKSGGVGHRSRGSKILYIAEESGRPKIIAETYSALMW